jgi:hypothetical protein
MFEWTCLLDIMSTTNEPYVTFRPFGISDLRMNRIVFVLYMLIPQVRPAHKYPNSPWETIHPPGGDNAVCVYPHKVYTAEQDKSLTATYQCKTPIPSNKLFVTNILTNN